MGRRMRRAWIHCSSDNRVRISRNKCAKRIQLCLVAILLFKMSSSDAKKNHIVCCSVVDFVIVLCGCFISIANNGLSYYHYSRHIEKQSRIGMVPDHEFRTTYCSYTDQGDCRRLGGNVSVG